MIIPDHLIRDLNKSTRPVVLYRNEQGEFVYGFVLRADEFITSLQQMDEARKKAGLPSVDDVSNPL
ncbi:hypothetical protein SM114_08145 [Erwinia pyrifoliae]|nr:hypothetical protein [Erwinia pyrifoliae]AUX72761.1 hypothetical protein CPI84_09885 [Erwinia pyrifoliae]MCA8876976.1 hypothetical protein [Erwinia pyrifoliae]CAX55533.1 conserved uncharacterized protein [Erwinia pyrifoliae Ep1/96]CAY74264.1 hypothetical protein EPYR_01884 [Erwinia pyrifoliae DSM 12163]